MSEMSPDAAELRKARLVEYGQYVADGPIRVNGALAFRDGDAVPASHVERGVVSKDRVKKVNTKAAAAAQDKE